MYTPKLLIEGVYLNNSAGVLYTAPASTKTRITAMTANNTSSIAQQFIIYLSQGSASPTEEERIVMKTLAPNETYSVFQVVGQILAETMTIQGVAAAAGAVTIYASGVDIT